jgi:hypothetical protein
MDAAFFSVFWKLDKSAINFLVSPEEGSSLPLKRIISLGILL